MQVSFNAKILLIASMHSFSLMLIFKKIIGHNMNSDTASLDQIQNGKPVRVFIPLTNRPDCIRAQCIYQQTSPPKFSLIFKPGVLPVDEIDSSKPAIINVDLGGPTVSLEANIVNIANSQTLDMTITKTINHEQMREFFRVDAVTSVISKSFETAVFDNNSEALAIAGKTVDISGSGILAIFEEKPPQTEHIRLEIAVPSASSETITVFAHQIRLLELYDGRFEVAYHFDEISDEDRDSIIGTCLVLQRQMLRLKVQVRDS
ncbi:MAG: hypothetical protein ACI8ZB_004572 [Desulforhopalus sp.]|jgi:hypothetical protein